MRQGQEEDVNGHGPWSGGGSPVLPSPLAQASRNRVRQRPYSSTAHVRIRLEEH